MDGVVTANSDRDNCLPANKEQDCKPDIACLFNAAPLWGERYNINKAIGRAGLSLGKDQTGTINEAVSHGFNVTWGNYD